MKNILLPVLLLVLGVASQSGCRTCQPCCNSCGNAHGSMANVQAEYNAAPACPSGACPLMAQDVAASGSPNLISFDGWLPPAPIADQP